MLAYITESRYEELASASLMLRNCLATASLFGQMVIALFNVLLMEK